VGAECSRCVWSGDGGEVNAEGEGQRQGGGGGFLSHGMRAGCAGVCGSAGASPSRGVFVGVSLL
jgi:hypothetical protein